MKTERFTVRIRQKFKRAVRENAKQLEGKRFNFYFGWPMYEDDPYPDEVAWIPQDENYPAGAPPWIASGDLVEVTDPKAPGN